jgi:hypothetical protein
MMILHQTRGDERATTSTWHVRVAVRVPRNDGTDLLSDATRRVETTDGVDDVEVVELRGVEPTLSATVVTVAFRVEAELTESALESRLADAPGTEAVEHVEPA